MVRPATAERSDRAMVSASGSSGKVYQNVIAFDANRVFGLTQLRVVVKLTGHAIKLPGVPWADHHVAVQSPLAQGAAAMRTPPVHGLNLTAHRMADHHHTLTQFKIDHRAGLYISQRSKPLKGHNSEVIMREFLRFFVATIFGVGLGCKTDGGLPVIGVVPKGANHIFWQTVHAGAIKAANESGYRVEWNAPSLEIDASRQIEIVDSMINRKLKGIALAPVDRKALVSSVERAGREGIPVAIFDSAIDTDQRLTYVATNNMEGGRLAARRIGGLLSGKGKVAVIGFMPGSGATMEREDGFQDEIRKQFPGIQIVALRYAKADRAKAMAETENVLTAHPDLAAVFADNESSSSGAVQALKSRNAKQVKMVAFDASAQLIQDCRDGWIDSLVVQDPFKMGYESARALIRKLKGEPVQASLDSGVRLVQRGEIDTPALKELLFPDIQQYLNAGPDKH
jgi:ribose transport system substrate-binding protein